MKAIVFLLVFASTLAYSQVAYIDHYKAIEGQCAICEQRIWVHEKSAPSFFGSGGLSYQSGYYDPIPEGEKTRVYDWDVSRRLDDYCYELYADMFKETLDAVGETLMLQARVVQANRRTGMQTLRKTRKREATEQKIQELEDELKTLKEAE